MDEITHCWAIERMVTLMNYEMFLQGPEVYIPSLIISVVFTLIGYGLFPFIFARVRNKSITRKKYYFFCYGVNLIVMIMAIAVNGGSSGAPYLLWTWVFTRAGAKKLESRGVLVGSPKLSFEDATLVAEESPCEYSNKNNGKRCVNCGKKVAKKQKFCPECGAVIVHKESNKCGREGDKGRIIIIALSILLMIALAVIIVLLVPGNGGTKKPSAEEETIPSKTGFSDDATAISKAAESVVKLNCFDYSGKLIATGSGFAALEEGVIITNYHVIEDQPERIEMIQESGKKSEIVGVIGASLERDIAILYYQYRNEGSVLPTLPVKASGLLQKGEKVVAIGSPMGLTNVVSTGVFSGYTNIDGVTDIQFTASISSGSSGGALFNNNGEIIGITYASIEDGQNLNLAVPMEFVESLWKTESKDRSTLYEFYDSLIPHYTVDYVLENYALLTDTEFYLDYWASSYGKVSSGHVAYCAASYDAIYDPDENVPEERFKGDNDRYHESSLLKVVTDGVGWMKEYRMEHYFGNRTAIKSILCTGVEWSRSDQRPYVIVKP